MVILGYFLSEGEKGSHSPVFIPGVPLFEVDNLIWEDGHFPPVGGVEPAPNLSVYGKVTHLPGIEDVDLPGEAGGVAVPEEPEGFSLQEPPGPGDFPEVKAIKGGVHITEEGENRTGIHRFSMALHLELCPADVSHKGGNSDIHPGMNPVGIRDRRFLPVGEWLFFLYEILKG